jgi:hydroxypyruvate isomerase
MSTVTRREVLTAAATAPLALVRQTPAPQTPAPLPPPRYTLSANIELMFTKDVPHAERIERVAAAGLKAFSFWGAANKDIKTMLNAQQKTGLACGSITGNGNVGWKTGLTATGYEEAFFKDFLAHIEVAKQFNVKNLICFLGQKQPNIPPEVQHTQIIEGLKKTGDIAAKHDVYFCLEPLNSVESPQMSVLSAKHGFQIIEEVNHPHVRLDFDMYHLQLSEGNLINNLRQGLRKQWIRFVEVGDVPGRREPGTGETNYDNIFKVLREEGFAEYVGLEHGTSSTAEHAMAVVRKVAGV